MKTILLSFTPDWFERLEKGTLKFEYRKHFPQEETTVYFYVSSPVKAITGVAYCLKPEKLSSWLMLYQDRPDSVRQRIEDYLTECRYAIPIKTFQPTNRISLETIKNNISDFIIPRMYYYIDNTELCDYLENNLTPTSECHHNSFEFISDEDICC